MIYETGPATAYIQDGPLGLEIIKGYVYGQTDEVLQFVAHEQNGKVFPGGEQREFPLLSVLRVVPDSEPANLITSRSLNDGTAEIYVDGRLVGTLEVTANQVDVSGGRRIEMVGRGIFDSAAGGDTHGFCSSIASGMAVSL
jgi:hypothetical protein